MKNIVYTFLRQTIAFLVGFLLFYIIEPYNFIAKNIINYIFWMVFYGSMDYGYRKWKRKGDKK